MVAHSRDELVRLTEAAVAVALSVLLGSIRLLELPSGGSIALATLPLLALALLRGVRVGVLAGVCAGGAHALSGGTIIHPAQLALDYLLAYGLLGVAGVAASSARSRAWVSMAIIAAMLAHLGAMVLSGIIFFAPVAGGAALAYSAAYNLATVGPEALLALWLVPGIMHAASRANPADSWRRGTLDAPAGRQRADRSSRARASIDTTHRPVRVSHAPARMSLTRTRGSTDTTPCAATLATTPTGFIRTPPFARAGLLSRSSPPTRASG